MPAWKTIITRDGPCENVSSTRSLPSALCPLPSAVCPLPSALCHLPSALCHLPSALCHLPSAICPLPSPICPLPSPICHLPFAISHLPSALCHLPSALSDPPSPSHQADRHSPFTVSRQFPWPGADRSPDLLTRSDSRLRVLWRARCDRTEGSWIKVEAGTTSGGRRRSTGKRP